MANRDGERVGCIQGQWSFMEPEEETNHPAHLLLFGGAVTGDGLLDQPGSIFENRDAGSQKRQKSRASYMSQLQGNPAIARMEDILDRRAIGPGPIQEAIQRVGYRRKSMQEIETPRR